MIYLCKGVMPWTSVIRMTFDFSSDWQLNINFRISIEPCDEARWTAVDKSSCWSSILLPFLRQISTASIFPPTKYYFQLLSYEKNSLPITDECNGRWFSASQKLRRHSVLYPKDLAEN
jgi:hypothetical protein